MEESIRQRIDQIKQEEEEQQLPPPLSIIDLLAKEFPPVTFITQDIIVKNGVTIISGDPAAGKTFFALFLAFAVANGVEFLDRFETTEGPILWIDEESGERRLYDRIKNNLKITTVPKHLIHFACLNKFKITNNKHLEWLKNLVITLKPALVIVDSFGTVSDGIENDAKEMTEVTGRFRDIAGMDTSVLLIHHNRKQFAGEKISGQTMRGSSAILANIDYQLQLVKGKDYIKLEQHKARDSEPMKSIQFRIETEESTGAMILKNYGEIDESKIVTATLKEEIPEWLETLEEPVSREEITQHFLTTGSKDTIRKTLSFLVKVKEIKMIGSAGKAKYARKTYNEQMAAELNDAAEKVKAIFGTPK